MRLWRRSGWDMLRHRCSGQRWPWEALQGKGGISSARDGAGSFNNRCSLYFTIFHLLQHLQLVGWGGWLRTGSSNGWHAEALILSWRGLLVYPDSLDLRLRNSGNPKLANSRFVSFIDKVSKATAAHCRGCIAWKGWTDVSRLTDFCWY